MFEEHLGLILFLWIIGGSAVIAMMVSAMADRTRNLGHQERTLAHS